MNCASLIPVPMTTCAFCGVQIDDPDLAFCEDCELSDCLYCGATTNRPLLSANLACRLCEEGEVA